MKRFNTDKLLSFMMFLSFTLYFYYLLSTGKINMFISPRMIRYTKASFAAFLILTMYQFTQIFTIKTRLPISKSYVLAAITLIIGISASKQGMNINIAYKKGVTAAPVKAGDNKVSNDSSDYSESEESIINKNGIIEFNDTNYANNLYVLGESLNHYKDKKISISGFVYKEKAFEKDQFVAARMMMSCCAADAQVVGIMCDYPNAISLESDQWVRVDGILSSTEQKEEDINDTIELPLIKVTHVEKIKKPDNIYIYP